MKMYNKTRKRGAIMIAAGLLSTALFAALSIAPSNKFNEIMRECGFRGQAVEFLLSFMAIAVIVSLLTVIVGVVLFIHGQRYRSFKKPLKFVDHDDTLSFLFVKKTSTNRKSPPRMRYCRRNTISCLLPS